MRLQIIGWALLVIAGSGFAVSVSIAQSKSPASAGGDVDYGRYLSSECVTCHQASGANKDMPSITGWKEEAFIAVMKAYKEEQLPNPVMQIVAASLEDDQIKALAAFFATLPSSN